MTSGKQTAAAKEISKVNKQDDLKNCAEPFDGNNYYKKALRFADDNPKAELEGDIKFIRERARVLELLKKFKCATSAANSETGFRTALSIFDKISN